MSDVNVVVFGGRLTASPQLRTTPTGTSVCNFTLANNMIRKKATGEKVRETAYADVTVWGRTAENAAQYLDRGYFCTVEGRLKTNTWEKNGQKQSKLVIEAQQVYYGDNSQKQQQAPGSSSEFDGEDPNQEY